jgi:hypothetical protein
MSENITITIEEHLAGTELYHQPYDYSYSMSDSTEERRPDFMSPRPRSPKKNIVSIISKRKFENAFDINTFDDERYGQNIQKDYFRHSIGHNVSYEPSQEIVINSIYNINDIIIWFNKYLASKKSEN